MVQASNIILTYFIIGAVMWGGGALALEDAGVVNFFVEDGDSGIVPDSDPGDTLENQAGVIQSVAALAVGGLVFVINLLSAIFTYLNWPFAVLLQHNAPPTVTVLLGGSFTAGFYLSMFSIVK